VEEELMIRHRRNSFTVAAAAAGVALVTAGIAGAATPDEIFTDAVAKLGITFASDVDLPQVGHSVCDMLTKGLAANVNTVPTVRGVVQTLQAQAGGIERKQAAGLMQAAVAVYCPEYRRIVGR
jgi:Protein of unknown function (DUF732)